MALLLYTGQRRSDVVKLGCQHERNGMLYYRQQKTRKEMVTPILPELRKVLDASPIGELTYLTTQYGRPYSNNGFGNQFGDWCLKAGLPHCSAHGLRKAGATIAAENGATEVQLKAIFGWDTLQQASRYTRKANQGRIAKEAQKLILDQDNDNNAGPTLDRIQT
jgi:integrase